MKSLCFGSDCHLCFISSGDSLVWKELLSSQLETRRRRSTAGKVELQFQFLAAIRQSIVVYKWEWMYNKDTDLRCHHTSTTDPKRKTRKELCWSNKAVREILSWLASLNERRMTKKSSPSYFRRITLKHNVLAKKGNKMRDVIEESHEKNKSCENDLIEKTP